MDEGINFKKAAIFLGIVVLMVVLVGVFCLYEKETDTVVEGILVNAGMNV